MDLSFPWPFGPALIAMLCVAAFFYAFSLFSSTRAPGFVFLAAIVICSFCVSLYLFIFGSQQNIREFSVASLSAFVLLVILVNMSGIYSQMRSALADKPTSNIVISLFAFTPLLFVTFVIYKYRYYCDTPRCRLNSDIFGDLDNNFIHAFLALNFSSMLIWGISMHLLEIIARIRNLTRIGK
ncbi:hypothetical protein [Neorhizobium galegae]|uniref:hypothetical protein n=1 Tax=Neorhizobium galegae TaxID=399 RepID=UPI002103078B|nr:hypothetical protein [Neorhizobium galegae]MCQ1834959.1 hypothetical protein [Neorhizobium galegae]